MNTSEFGNLSWVFYVVAAYAIVFLSLLIFTFATWKRVASVRQALNEEGFSSEETM
ncbi:heme exporter protein CcmD [bacterium]|nr:heme exporter protein CcmD [bacterium]